MKTGLKAGLSSRRLVSEPWDFMRPKKKVRPATCCTFSLIVGCHYSSSFLRRLPQSINLNHLIDSYSVNQQDVILVFWASSILRSSPRCHGLPGAEERAGLTAVWVGGVWGIPWELLAFISCLLQLLSYLTPASLPGGVQILRSSGLSQLFGSLHLNPSYSISIVSFHWLSWKKRLI